MQALSHREVNALIAMVCDQHGFSLDRQTFAEAVLELFEDIAGFEAMPPEQANQLVLKLWSKYMAKKTAVTDNAGQPLVQLPPGGETQDVSVDLARPAIQAAIGKGKAAITEGKSKADAARVIFADLLHEPKEVLVAAFVEGATLTPKGALTYWYNIKRRASKDKKED